MNSSNNYSKTVDVAKTKINEIVSQQMNFISNDFVSYELFKETYNSLLNVPFIKSLVEENNKLKKKVNDLTEIIIMKETSALLNTNKCCNNEYVVKLNKSNDDVVNKPDIQNKFDKENENINTIVVNNPEVKIKVENVWKKENSDDVVIVSHIVNSPELKFKLESEDTEKIEVENTKEPEVEDMEEPEVEDTEEIEVEDTEELEVEDTEEPEVEDTEEPEVEDTEEPEVEDTEELEVEDTEEPEVEDTEEIEVNVEEYTYKNKKYYLNPANGDIYNIESDGDCGDNIIGNLKHGKLTIYA